ncbi:MAG: protein kinase domain-containing protein [Pseudanabaenaceae cyanobacterium]
MLTVGTVLRRRYRILRVLGSGGFGDTYLAEDTDLPGHPKCVVKQLRPKDDDPEVFRVAKALFEREAEYLYKIGNLHPDIPDLYAHFTEGGEFYLVQEYIEGENLANELPPGKTLTEGETIRLLLDILEVLSFVHQQNVIHRDIKLSNLIRRKSNGKIVLIDFGAVKDVSGIHSTPQGLTNMTVGIGSPGYMPSEQAQGKPKLSSDVYAVGMIGIQALTGIPPASLPEDPNTGELLWQNLVSVSPKLAEILKKMTHYHFGQRYPSAIEALAALRALVAETDNQPTQLFNSPEPTIFNPPPRPQPVPATAYQPVPQTVHLSNSTTTSQPTNPVIFLSVLVGIAALAGSVVWWLMQSNQRTPAPSTPVVETVPSTPIVTSPTPESPSVNVPEVKVPDVEVPEVKVPNLASPTPTLPAFYGAIARSPKTGDKGYAANLPTAEQAQQEALRNCASQTGAVDCEVMVWFANACGSIAEAENGGAGAGSGSSPDIAESNAINACNTVGTNCIVLETFCTANAP